MTLMFVIIVGMGGFGDNVYQRPFVRAVLERHGSAYLRTPWPEIYEDFRPNLKLLPFEQLSLRTQDKNMARQRNGTYELRIPRGQNYRIRLACRFKRPQDNVITEFERQVPLKGPFVFDLPTIGRNPIRTEKPIAVLRPATVREEWPNPARNPDPRYIAMATAILREQGFHTVSVADVEPPAEVFIGRPPEVDEFFHSGELQPRQLLALVRKAAVVVGPVGWIVPASIAYKTPLIVIGGGCGGYNHPRRITDPRMDLSHARFILPDPYCDCINKAHRCNKKISGFETRFRNALAEVA